MERQHIQYDPELIGFRNHADCRYYYHTRTLLRIDFYADRAQQHPTFANKVLGDGVVIFPEDGTVMAPCKATVSLVYPTGHAIGLTTADGAEILIHCGVDTVNMNGEGFETLVKEGQEVTAEEALIRFDIDLVKKHGYSPEILVIFTELPEGKTIKTEEKHIAKNDKMAEIV